MGPVTPLTRPDLPGMRHIGLADQAFFFSAARIRIVSVLVHAIHLPHQELLGLYSFPDSAAQSGCPFPVSLSDHDVFSNSSTQLVYRPPISCQMKISLINHFSQQCSRVRRAGWSLVIEASLCHAPHIFKLDMPLVHCLDLCEKFKISLSNSALALVIFQICRGTRPCAWA